MKVKKEKCINHHHTIIKMVFKKCVTDYNFKKKLDAFN